MNSKTWTRIIALTLFAALAIPVSLAAQDNAKRDHHHKYHHYQLIDPGTFGGPQSFLSFAVTEPPAGILNNRGTLTGSADTLTVDPYCLDNPDCYAAHARQWQDGVTTDLGVLPGGVGSQVTWISASGLMAGTSDNGQPDPLSGGGLPQIHAVLWNHGGITDLGTLEGGYQSFPYAVNNRGEVVGQTENTIPDPNSFFGYGYQTRAFYWKNGVMKDLGTLGTGTDAMALLMNERGQVVGWSYTNSVPSAICLNQGRGAVLTTSSFIWDKKNKMRDIGGLGGTCTLANDVNNRGQIVGASALTGDPQVHPFVWNAATGVIDLLDPADGNYGYAHGENDRGDVVGVTCSPKCSALLWRKRGGHWRKTVLSAITDASAEAINASGQVVGDANGAAFLWEDGGPIVDLNTLVPPNSGLQLDGVQKINDRGEIAVYGTDASGNLHAVILIPCDEQHPGVEGCDYSMVDAATAAQSPAPRYVPSATQRLPQSRRTNRYHLPGYNQLAR